MANPVKDNTEIKLTGGGGFVLTGDAITLMRILTLKQACDMYAKHKMLLTRIATPTRMLTMATEYTGKKYKRGGHAAAAADLQVTCDLLRASIPTTGPTGEAL